MRDGYKWGRRDERVRGGGMLTTREVAAKFGVSKTTVYEWGRQGLITKCCSDHLNRGLWTLPAQQTILKGCGGRDARAARLISIAAQSPEQGAVLHTRLIARLAWPRRHDGGARI